MTGPADPFDLTDMPTLAPRVKLPPQPKTPPEARVNGYDGEGLTLSPDHPDDVFSPTQWQGLEVIPRAWLIEGYLPLGEPIMLSGVGGLGKSLLGLQLAHAAATGEPWLGKQVAKCKALAVLCEDDKEELHRRFYDINANTGREMADLEDLRLIIRDGQPSSSLMDFPGPYEAGTESEFYTRLMAEVTAFKPSLIILDSLYNFFHGNENNRVQVAQFVYALKRIARASNAALVFIAHPSKSGISAEGPTAGYAGNTAWHDAVRARLFLTEEDNEGEKRLVLNTMKQNYGPREGSIEVYYQGGMLWPRSSETTGVEPLTLRLQAEVVFLRCLRTAHEQGKNVSHSKTSTSFAPKIFAKFPEAAGFRQGDLNAAMDRLFADKRIKTGPYKSAGRKVKEGIFEVQNATEGDDVSTQNDPKR